MKYADIILPLPLDGLFTYGVPTALESAMAVGKRVLCPLGKTKRYIGIVAAVHDRKPAFEIKNIVQVLDDEPSVPEKQLRLWQWVSDYYLSPIGDVYKAALPSGLKAEEGWRPRTELFIALSPTYYGSRGIAIARSMLMRAPKQLNALNVFLFVGKSRWRRTVHRVASLSLRRYEISSQDILDHHPRRADEPVAFHPCDNKGTYRQGHTVYI